MAESVPTEWKFLFKLTPAEQDIILYSNAGINECPIPPLLGQGGD